MVRGQTAFAKNNWREIRKTLGRYIAILAIVALGVGFFSGLRVTKQAMVKTGDIYLSEHNFYDFRLISTYGLTEEDAAYITSLDGVTAAEGSISFDFLRSDEQGTESAWKALTITGINTPNLQAGRLPERADEVLADAQNFGEEAIGTQWSPAGSNSEDTLENFACQSYTIVGLCDSPLYLNIERGSTSLASGKLSGFFYFLPEGLSSDYYTEIYVTIEKTGSIFTDEYAAERDDMEPVLTAALEDRAALRFDDILSEAEADYADGLKEYNDGLETYHTERAEAEQELADAEAELAEARRTLDDAKEQLNDSAGRLADAEQELADGQTAYEEGCAQLQAARDAYEAGKAETEAELASRQAELDDARAEAEAGLAQLQAAGAEELLAQYEQLQTSEQQIQTALAACEPDSPETAALQTQLQQVQAGLEQITATGLPDSWQALQEAFEQLSAGQAALDKASEEAQAAFADAEQQLQETENTLYSGCQQLQTAGQELSDGQREFSDALMEYQDGEEDYAEGLAEYEEAAAEAEKQFADAEAELADAEAELADARREIDELEGPNTYVLNRDTNVGYVCYDNDSQIVQGVSRVFPIFFFLVAALVCVTTMTRMVDDQRTQIGTLKALGYSNGRIVWKYVSYSGSAAVIGSIAGFLIGSALFPTCIWMGYRLLYGFGNIKVVFNWGLGLISLAVALACSAGATYLACRKDLHQVPAELMRPRAPAVGKRIWLEHLPFIWKRFSFLHKVTARNIFRYKKRLIMMVLGIGGCTALVITGLGLRDSICNIAEDQFGSIMKYDYAISFAEEMTEADRQAFAGDTADLLQECVLLCSDTIDAEAGGAVKSANIIACSDQAINSVVDLTIGGSGTVWPDDGGVVISDNLADRLGLSVGDTIKLRTDETHTVSLPVTGIFKNHVYFYVLMTEQTYESVLGREITYNTTYANAGEGDLHDIAAQLVNDRGAASVTVMTDLRERVNNMLNSMYYIVALVIACAAALAFVVLFNLSNINITERVREIATIEVLGFSDAETASYVFRENAVLTLMGALVGLPLGKWLHAYVMQQIRIDMVSFEVRVTPLSYVIAFALTFVFTLLVDLIMRRKLHAIDMAEALKSVE